MQLVLTTSQYQEMLSHVSQWHPLEACGLLAGAGQTVNSVYPIDNILRSPTAYEMEPTQQLKAMLDFEAQGDSLLAIYHSHPQGPEYPSQTDVEKAYYPEAVYVIISLRDTSKPVAAAFTIVSGKVSSVVLKVE